VNASARAPSLTGVVCSPLPRLRCADTTGKGRGTFTGSSSFTVKEVWAFAL